MFLEEGAQEWTDRPSQDEVGLGPIHADPEEWEKVRDVL